MGDIETRPFSKNYSGLVNQSVIALCITVVCVTSQELMKRRRRGIEKLHGEGLGSRESWEFGYLFQGRSWAKNPSPPSPAGWPLSWIKQIVSFPEDKMNELRGIDATLYIRFLRGCFWFSLIQTFTTLPILFPIHVHFAEDVSTKSMTRASIASLVATSQGLSLLWIHICLLFWLTLTWMATLIWITRGAFRLRAQQLEMAAQRIVSATTMEKDAPYHPHPHPQFHFQDAPSLNSDREQHEGLRLRTVMVTNIPHALRSEKELKEYFEKYMSRPLDKPSIGLTSSTQPGFFNKILSFALNRAKRIPGHLPTSTTSETTQETDTAPATNTQDVPVITRVVVVRKMTELASLLERREEILNGLEKSHIRLAKKTLLAVKQAMDRRLHPRRPVLGRIAAAIPLVLTQSTTKVRSEDVERGDTQEGSVEGDERMDVLIHALAPYVEEFGLHQSSHVRSTEFCPSFSKRAFWKLRTQGSEDNNKALSSAKAPVSCPPSSTKDAYPRHPTIWEALLGLERNILDAYQPLVNLSHVFRGQTVPAIDFYTAKLGLLTTLITKNRSKPITEYDPVSSAFVTFADPIDARKACRYLAVHPNNPLLCLVTMAPMYQDLDWNRIMKSVFRAEFIKDSVVNMGVWAFTLFWLLPVSLLVSLVSIQNISAFFPKLKAYLDRHDWEEELLQSFLPTLLVALLALLIPLILLLIAKKAHTIIKLSALHDWIMVRYYKFLIVNVLVFFCVGTLALQSVVADSFPTAGPFYVGWLIFTMAMHAGFELTLFGLPLIMYPSTSRQVTPRKRAVGIRPRTFNFYYWLPNHMLIMHILLLFAIFNPFVIPFSTFYFFVETGVVKNQLIHVYAKNYECNGQILLIRFVRYSLDGLMLSQSVFLAYMVVLKRSVSVGLTGFLLVFTAIFKIAVTRMIRVQHETDDISEAQIVCGHRDVAGEVSEFGRTGEDLASDRSSGYSTEARRTPRQISSIWTRGIPEWMNFSYSPTRQRVHPIHCRPKPFRLQSPSFSQFDSSCLHYNGANSGPTDEPQSKVPADHLSERTDLATQEPRVGPIVDADPCKGEILEPLSPVVNHPAPVAWDDESHMDLPYDNPYYTRAIDNVIWLPRNPFGILDLDDTVDLRVPLTSIPYTVPLGTWLGDGETSSPKSMSFSGPSDKVPQRQYSGLEEIDLPPAIAKRVRALDKEDDIEDTIQQRPSMFGRRKPSSGDKGSLGGPRRMRRSSTVDGPPQLGFHLHSAGSGSRHRSASVLSALEPPRVGHLASTDYTSGSRPDVHAQADFVRSNLPTTHASASQPSVSSVPPTSSRSQNVTTHEALISEVIAQEVSALADRMDEEWAALRKEQSKSWLTSWMFQRGR